MQKIRISTTIDKELHTELKKTAKEKGKIFSAYLREIVIKALEKEKEELNDN